MYDVVAIIRSLTAAGIAREHADEIVSAMPIRTTIRPQNTPTPR